MAKFKEVAVAIFHNATVRKDLWDIVKVVVGVIGAKYGVKLA
jgi:hypothetical protein